MKQQSTSRLVTVAFVLAIGFGVVWGFGLGTVASFIESLVRSTIVQDYEDMMVDSYGKPLIQVRVGGDFENIQYKTLEGKVVDIDSANVFSPTSLNAPFRAPRLFEYPITWRERVAGIIGSEKPAVSWVLLRDADRPGKAYFVGHHPKSNQLAGYIGRRGPRTSIPPDDEQFDVGDSVFEYGTNLLKSPNYINIGGLGNGYSSQSSQRAGRLKAWQVFLCDGNLVREINLQNRDVRGVKEFDQLVGVSAIDFTPLDALRTDDRWPEQRLLVRCQERLIVYNTFDDTEVEFKIPVDLRGEPFSVNTVGAEELLLHVNRGPWERGRVVDLILINPAGEIQEEQTVKLLSYSNQPSALDFLIPALAAPTLFGWILGIFVVAPLSMLQTYVAPDYAAGIRMAWDQAWPGFLAILVLSCVLTVIVQRWQHKFSRPHTPLWVLFVAATTLPGFFAYWVMHRREPLAACPSCKSEVPRNREACARCAEPFPEPKLLGTEVFA